MAKRRYKVGEVAAALHEAQGVISTAAKILGCSRQTIYDYVEKSVTVEKALRASRKGLVGEAQGYLVAMMRDRGHKDHYKAVMKVLLAYDDETDWSEKERKEITGAGADGALRIEIINKPAGGDADS